MNNLRKNKKLESIVDVSYKNDSNYFEDDSLEKQFYRFVDNKSKAQLTLDRNKEKWSD